MIISFDLLTYHTMIVSLDLLTYYTVCYIFCTYRGIVCSDRKYEECTTEPCIIEALATVDIKEISCKQQDRF